MTNQESVKNLAMRNDRSAMLAQLGSKREVERITTSRLTDREGITPREHEILKLICEELSPGEISEELKISEKTFFNHRANILQKIGAKTNVGLVKYAIVKKVVEVEL